VRVVDENIEVKIARNSPSEIRRGPITYQVSDVLGYWIVQSKWWLREERRLYMHLITDHGMVEVFRRDNDWILSKIWD
jgi:hypothetical protein